MTKLSFHRKPMPIYAEHRPLYKVAHILFVLEVASRGGKSSILKLQLFNWAVKEEVRMKKIESAAETGRLEISIWGIDPILNAAIQFAISEGLVRQESSNIILTDKGKGYIKSIKKEDILLSEKSFYLKVKKKISESMISQVVDSWG